MEILSSLVWNREKLECTNREMLHTMSIRGHIGGPLQWNTIWSGKKQEADDVCILA